MLFTTFFFCSSCPLQCLLAVQFLLKANKYWSINCCNILSFSVIVYSFSDIPVRYWLTQPPSTTVFQHIIGSSSKTLFTSLKHKLILQYMSSVSSCFASASAVWTKFTTCQNSCRQKVYKLNVFGVVCPIHTADATPLNRAVSSSWRCEAGSNIFSKYTISGCNQTTRSTQPCTPSGSLNRVPASAGVKAGMSPLPGGR